MIPQSQSSNSPEIKAHNVFERYLKTDSTKFHYQNFFNRFLRVINLSEDQLLSKNNKELTTVFEDYIIHLKKTVSPNSISTMISPVQFFMEMNDISLNFKRLRKMCPPVIKKSGYDTWKQSDIRNLISYANSKRNRAIIYTLVSTGCRAEALLELQFKDLEQLDAGCAKVVFYAGSKDEYTGYLTPEANQNLKSYLKTRTMIGKENYVFTKFNQSKLSYEGLKDMLIQLEKKIPGDSRTKDGNRYNIQLIHGFRKYFATKVKLNENISSAVAEKLLGHKVDLDESYFRPGKELFDQFKKIIPDLIIDSDQKLIQENKELRTTLEEKLEASEKRMDRLLAIIEASGQSLERVK